jgi:hypothetical protein
MKFCFLVRSQKICSRVCSREISSVETRSHAFWTLCLCSFIRRTKGRGGALGGDLGMTVTVAPQQHVGDRASMQLIFFSQYGHDFFISKITTGRTGLHFSTRSRPKLPNRFHPYVQKLRISSMKSLVSAHTDSRMQAIKLMVSP